METDDEILEISPRTRFSTYDYPPMHKRENVTRNRHTLTFSDLPQRSRSMVNLAPSQHHHPKRHTWLLPESPTVSEKQAQLTKRRSLAGVLSPPAPKVPNVGRYLEIFARLKNAYSGFVKACENVESSSLSGKDKMIFDKCRRKLTAKLIKIRDLHELYVHQEHMREGAQNLLKTMERESSKKIKSGIDYCSRNLRKNVTRLCAVEDEVDTMSGTMNIEIIGLIGFARLSPGDVYGVQFKHGHEKSNSKCKVVGQGQKWTNTNIKFKITPTHDLVVKVHEVRKINTNNIGTASCPIAGFLSAEGQEFVLPVNSTGTLKLKICATWSPFTNKEENALRGKVPIIASSNIHSDSLSDTISYASSPCSTPRNGTLSSMPNMSTNGTLTPMKISVSGTVFSSHASVSKHSRIENDPASLSDATFIEQKDSNWSAEIKAQSLPDITKITNDEVALRTGSEADTKEQSASSDRRGMNGSLAHSSDQLNERVIFRDERETNKKKPRPITLGPTFTTGFSSQSDYENVVNLISASIMGEEPDVIPKDRSSNRKKKHRPMSVGPSFPHVPPPDYAPDCSPDTPVTSPTFLESSLVLAVTEPDHSVSDENANYSQEKPAKKSSVTEPKRPAPVISEPDYPSSPVEKTVDLVGQSTVELEDLRQENELKATTLVSSSTVMHENKVPITDIGTDALILAEENIDNDRLQAEIRAISLDLLLRLAAVPSDLSSRLTNLEAVVNELTNLLKEKKTALSRTASIENALNSIDNAFDFLADHQTMKPDTLLEEGRKEILPRKWNIFKFVLRHHLKASQNMLKAVQATDSPLKVKQEKLIKQIKKQSAVLEVLNDLLTIPGPISMKSALQKLNYPEELCTVWKMHCSKNEFKCSSDEILNAIKELYRQCDTKAPLSNDVCLTTLQKIQDDEMNCFNSQLVSVFQFADFFSRNYNLTVYFQAAFKEVRVMKALTSTDDLVLLSVLQDRKIILIVSSCLKKLAEQIQSKNRTVQRLIVEFYTKLALENKEKAIDIYLELLESSDLSTRTSACTALKYLEALKARDQIAYLWQNDEGDVRKAAFEALKVVGFPEGMEPSTDVKLGFIEVSTRL